MVRRFFIDVETLPPPEESRPLINTELVKRLCRKRGTLSADEQFRLLSLHAEYGRVLAVGVIVEEEWRVTQCGVLGRDRATGLFHLDEARTLRAFWKLLKGFNARRDLVIGHNIMDFDLPYLYKRSRINRVLPGVIFSFARYRSAPIFDIMREWTHWSPQAGYISLAHLADILKVGAAKLDGMDGGLVYDRFMQGDHGLIADYCLQDVKVARAVYYRMMFPEGPEPQEAG